MKKQIAVFLMICLLVPLISPACADRTAAKHNSRYIGAMRVVKCQQYVTLREKPYKTARELARVPLGAIVYNCSSIQQKKSFYYCEYDGIQGYILAKFLEPAPEYEPAVTSATTRKMTMDEVAANAEIILDWQDYNITVLAAREFVRNAKTKTEILRIGCYIDGDPLWGHEEMIETTADTPVLRAFIAGTKDDPAVMIYDGGYGLTMLDLLTGTERWTVFTGSCSLGDAAAVAVGKNGNMYIAGTEGPDPVAISPEGRIIWKTRVIDPDVYAPYQITLESDTISVRYRSGMLDGYMLAVFDYSGGLIGINEMND